MKENRLVWAAYLAVCVVWGSTYLAIRIGVQELPPLLLQASVSLRPVP